MPWVDVTDPAEIEAAKAQLGVDDSFVMNRDERLKMQAAGMPVLSEVRDPYARITDPKRRDMARTQQLATGQKIIAKGSETSMDAGQRLVDLQEFENLSQQGTGGLGGFLQSRMPPLLQTSRAQRLEQLSAGLAAASRLAGTGTVSDFDAAQLIKQTGGLEKSAEANKAFAQATKAAQKVKMDRQAFNDAFLQANSTTIGADALWKQYVNANPLYDKKGKYIGDTRMSWDQYYTKRAQQALRGENPDAPPRPSAPQGNSALVAQVRAELARRQALKGKN
jgi:hypothetical protein